MKKIFTLITFACLSLPAFAKVSITGTVPAVPHSILPTISLADEISPCGNNLCGIQTAEETIKPMSIDTSTWATAEGEWFLKSNYTKKSYPTQIKYTYVTKEDGSAPTQARICITNDLWGTVYLLTSLITGEAASYYDYENDKAIYNKIKDENGTELDITTSISVIPLAQEPSIGSWVTFPLSGYSQLPVTYIPLVDGEPDRNNRTLCYEYLYNTKAKECKIKAEYKRSYYNGEKTARVKLQKGTDVTDVYYIIANELIDYQTTLEIAPDFDENGDFLPTTVMPSYINKYITGFKTGKTNPAVTVGLVAENATEFDVPLPATDGIRYMFIVAYCGDQITDLVYDLIEVKKPQTWVACGKVDFSHDVYNGSIPTGDTFIAAGTYRMEVNADSTRYRIVAPFATDKNPEANYLYINASCGLDSCYLEPSYSPIPQYYPYQDFDGNDLTAEHPFIISDWVGINLFRGGNVPRIMQILPDSFFDLTSGISSTEFFAEDYYMCLYNMKSGAVYINWSMNGPIYLRHHSAVTGSADHVGVTFEVGEAVDYLVCSFGYNSTHPESRADDTASGNTFKLNVSDGVASVDIRSLINSGQIPGNPDYISYSAYDINNNLLRNGILSLLGQNYNNVMANCHITFTDTEFFTDGDLKVIRTDSAEDGTSVFEIINIGAHMRYAPADACTTFTIDKDGLKDNPESFFMGTYYFGVDLGDLDMYAEFYDSRIGLSSSDNSEERAVLEGRIKSIVYKKGTTTRVGYFKDTDYKLYMPKDFIYKTAGIEDIRMDDNTPAVYYNLQGMRIENPASGSVVIEVKGGNSRKVIFR